MQRFVATLVFSVGTRTPEMALLDVLGLVRSLDDYLGPFDIRLGEGEPKGPPATDKRAKQLASAQAGFMAFSPSATVDVTKSRAPASRQVDAVKATIWVEVDDDALVLALVDHVTSLTDPTLLLAHGGSEAERRQLNFAVIPLEKGSVEAYVGRNHRRFLPGLYWWNLWSLEWIESLGVALETVPSAWSTTLGKSKAHVQVRGNFRWQDWSRYHSESIAWAQGTPGVFSMVEMMSSKPDRLSELSSLRFIRPWK